MSNADAVEDDKKEKSPNEKDKKKKTIEIKRLTAAITPEFDRSEKVITRS